MDRGIKIEALNAAAQKLLATIEARTIRIKEFEAKITQVQASLDTFNGVVAPSGEILDILMTNRAELVKFIKYCRQKHKKAKEQEKENEILRLEIERLKDENAALLTDMRICVSVAEIAEQMALQRM